MRSLALLLILANIILFAWQKSMLPWIPWQPDSFVRQKSYFPSSDLPQLVLLSEHAERQAKTQQLPVKTEIAQAETEINNNEDKPISNDVEKIEKVGPKLDKGNINGANTEVIEPIENTDNIVAKAEPLIFNEAIFADEKMKVDENKNNQEFIDQEFETAESIFEEIETAALKNENAESENTNSELESDNKGSNSKAVEMITENLVETITEKNSDSQTVVIPKEIKSGKNEEKVVDSQSIQKANNDNQFLSAFANFYSHLVSTTISLLNVPINPSDSHGAKIIVQIGTNDAHIMANTPTDKLANSVENTEKEKVAESEKIEDIQEESENKKPDHSTLAEKPKSNIQKDSVNAQPSDSSDDSKAMTILAKASTVPIETTETKDKTEVENITESENQNNSAISDNTDNTQVLCFQAGPYADSNSVKNLVNWFTKQKVNAKIQQRKIPVLESTWVYLPPFHNRRIALRTQQLLTKQGISDHALAIWKKNPNTVSLGLFRDPINAELRIKELRDKGFFDVQSEKRYKNDTRYWLSVKIPYNQKTLTESFRKKFKAHRLKSMVCD